MDPQVEALTQMISELEGAAFNLDDTGTGNFCLGEAPNPPTFSEHVLDYAGATPRLNYGRAIRFETVTGWDPNTETLLVVDNDQKILQELRLKH